MATLHLTEPRCLVRRDAETLIIEVPADEALRREKRSVRVPLIKVDQVVVHGNSTLTAPAIAALMAQRTEICFLGEHGDFRGRLVPAFTKNVEVRMEQHRAHDQPARAFPLARAFVTAKLANMRTQLLRSNRHRADDALAAAAERVRDAIDAASALQRGPNDPPPDPVSPQRQTVEGQLLGTEGAGSAAYFGAFSHMLSDGWLFSGRVKRPPTDPVNALLSYGYVLLMHQVASAAQVAGLDPQIGYLHSARYGKPALALDLMGEFRPVIVDSTVLTLLNTGMLAARDFVEEGQAFRLTDAGRRVFLAKLEDRLQTEIQHPVFGYKVSYRRCLELQARLLAKTLVGEIPEYRPFLSR